MVSVIRTVVIGVGVLPTAVTYPASAATAPIAALVLVNVVASLPVLVRVFRAAHGPSCVLLPVHQSHSRDRVLVVVAVLVAAFDQLLLGLLQAEGAHESLSVAGYVDVRHIARVVDTRLSLQMVTSLVMMASLVDSLSVVQRLLTVALVNRVLLPLAVQVRLTGH